MLTKSYMDKRDSTSKPEEDVLLYELFDRARKQGIKTEFVNLQTGERVDNGYILDQSNKYAKGLLSLGILEQGVDCMMVIGCNSMEMLAVWTGCLSIGIASAHPNVYVPRVETLKKVTGLVKPKVIIVGDGSDEEVLLALVKHFDRNTPTPNSETLPSVQKIYYAGKNRSYLEGYPFLTPLTALSDAGETTTDMALEDARGKVNLDFVSHIVYSSGTTGTPKCIQNTHRNMCRQVAMTSKPGSQKTLILLGYNNESSLSFNNSVQVLAGCMRKLVLGPDSSRMLTDQKFAKICVEAIIKEGVSDIVLMASKLDLVCDYFATHHSDDAHPRNVILSGQCYTQAFKDKIQQCMNANIWICYGMSECIVIAIGFGDKYSTLPGTEIRLVDEEGHIVDIGSDGQIEIKSPMVFAGYRGEEEMKRGAFTTDSFLKTGDVGVMFEDGTFAVRGRAGEGIKFNVERRVVWPSAIEEAIARHPLIKEFKVVSYRLSDLTGDELVYCIRMIDGAPQLSVDATIDYCKNVGLSQIQFPSRVLCFDELPLTPNFRKHDLKKLRELVIERIEADENIGVAPLVDNPVF